MVEIQVLRVKSFAKKPPCSNYKRAEISHVIRPLTRIRGTISNTPSKDSHPILFMFVIESLEYQGTSYHRSYQKTFKKHMVSWQIKRASMESFFK